MSLVMLRTLAVLPLALLISACSGGLSVDGDGGGDGDGDERDSTGSGGALGSDLPNMDPLPDPNLPGGTGGSTVDPAPVTYEEVTLLIEENGAGFCELGEDIEFEHAGFAGDGYVNTANIVGSALEWDVTVPVPGMVTVSVRYATESTGRPGTFVVDGVATGINLTLGATGAWTTWNEESASLVLTEGSHRIRLEAQTEDGLPNIDSVTLTGFGIGAGTCTDESLDPVCTPGAVTCLDDVTPQICSPDGQWQAQTPCAFACQGTGACTGACTPGARQCLDSETPQLCDAGGVWQDESPCAFVCQAGGTCGGSCVPGSRQCSGATPQVCTPNGTWQSEATCANACTSGVCSSCTPGQKQCLDANTPQTCADNGTWSTGSDCAYVCNAGSCGGSCVPGSRDCLDTNTPRLCSSEGAWQNQSDCAYVCDDGICGGSCVPGAKQCSGSTPQTCSDSGSWSNGSVCANGCTNGTCNQNTTGVIRISDAVPGWASVAASGLSNGTTGGGQNVGSATTVSSMSALQSAASGSGSAIVFVQAGTYTGTLNVGSNKTIIGVGPGATIRGNIRFSGSSNVIMRNLAVRGNTCSSYDDCRAGPDAVGIENSAHHIWLDHMDIADGEDGNCDITKEADYVTVSYSKFHYTYNKEHRFSNLISSSDDSTEDAGKLRISYMNSWWGDRVNQRMPRGRFGKVHLLNNYFSSGDSGQIIHGPGVQASYIIEGNYYEVPSGTQSIRTYDSSATVRAVNNSGTASGMNQTIGSVFSIPYSFTAIASSQVKARVTASSGGAGNTCTFSN